MIFSKKYDVVQNNSPGYASFLRWPIEFPKLLQSVTAVARTPMCFFVSPYMYKCIYVKVTVDTNMSRAMNTTNTSLFTIKDSTAYYSNIPVLESPSLTSDIVLVTDEKDMLEYLL